jgi:hypothetical protein
MQFLGDKLRQIAYCHHPLLLQKQCHSGISAKIFYGIWIGSKSLAAKILKIGERVRTEEAFG